MNLGASLKIWKFGAEFQIRNNLQKDRRLLGIWMRDELVSLGPAFIKIGQFLSTRVDIFGKDVTSKLSELQDRIEPIPYESMVSVLVEDIPEYNDLFIMIDPEPIASASIGQVHRARLAKTNQEIVLKIQKPDVAYTLTTDLNALISINQFFAYLGFQPAKDFDTVLQQYIQFLEGELDFMNEAKYMLFFRRKLGVGAGAGAANVYIPKPLSQSTKRVLVMEYVPSTKINEVKQDPALAAALIQVFLYQIIKVGAVHCDPHPGNIGVRADGRLVLYDFGNVIKLTPEFRAKVNNLVFAIYQKDIDEFTDLLLELNIIQLESSLDVLELKAFFNYFFDYLETLNFDELKTAVLNKDIFYNSNIRFKVDPNFLSLFRVFSLMDGTCSALDPEFNYITALAPFSEQLFMDANFINYRARKDLQALSAYPKLLKNTDQNILRVNRRFSKMSESMFDMRFLFITVAIVDNAGDPLRIAILVSLFGYFFWKEDN